MKNKLFDLLLCLCVLAGIIFVKSCWCIRLSLVSPEKILEERQIAGKVVVLYGYSVCGSCSSGSFIDKLKDKKNVTFVLPEELRQSEIESFQRAFSVKGKIISGNEKIRRYLKILSKCRRRDVRNIVICFNDKNKATVIKEI